MKSLVNFLAILMLNISSLCYVTCSEQHWNYTQGNDWHWNNNGPWEGGLGHSLIDILGAIYTAKQSKKSIFIPRFKGKLMAQATEKTYSFGPEPLTLDSSWVRDRRFSGVSENARAQTFIKDVLPLLSLHECKTNIDVGDMLIHMRSGDIFSPAAQSYVWHDYVQPPLAYYQAIISKHKKSLRRITILTAGSECCPNPILDPLMALLKEYQIETQLINNQTLDEDFSTIALSQAIFVHSASAFSFMAGLCNCTLTSNIQYIPDYAQSFARWLMGSAVDLPQIKTINIGGEFSKRLFNLKNKYGLSFPWHDFMTLYDPSVSTVVTP